LIALPASAQAVVQQSAQLTTNKCHRNNTGTGIIMNQPLFKTLKLENGKLVEDANISPDSLVRYEDIKPYLTQHPNKPEPTEIELIQSAILNSIDASIGNFSEVKLDDTFDYLELDSLHMAELEMDLISEFGVDYDDTDFNLITKANTPREMADIVLSIHNSKTKR
jgi:acyl carrier protein